MHHHHHLRSERETAVGGAPSPGVGVADGAVVDERSRLLLPSPTSTDSPVRNGTATNGSHLSDDDDNSGTVPLLKGNRDREGAPNGVQKEIQLVRSFGSLEGLEDAVVVEDIEDGKGGGRRGGGKRGFVAAAARRCSYLSKGKKARCVLAALVAVVAASLVGWRILGKGGPAGGGGGGPPWRPSAPKIHEDDRHGGNVSSWAFNRQPLSLLDPVEDLMLLGFKRPKDSRPKPVLTRGGMNGGDNHDGEDHEDESTPGPFPTGAWYQNLLLVDGEPSGIHRTYSIPYIVDVTGPIPGLRLHGNRVGASSEVVQVYNVDEYGLTVGAARDVTLRARSKPLEETHQYRVKKATNLGLTLQWVRVLSLCKRSGRSPRKFCLSHTQLVSLSHLVLGTFRSTSP